jgi:4-aminobutyrate aminotransferase
MQQTATSAPSAKPAARTYPSIKTALPGPLAKAIVDRDRAFTSHAYLKEYPLVIARGEGVMVEDVDGNRFLDFMSGIAVSSTGYGHPKVIAARQRRIFCTSAVPIFTSRAWPLSASAWPA